MLSAEKSDALAAISAAQLAEERADAMDYYLGHMNKDTPAQEGAMESRARRNGWGCVVSDTTGNVASANNFIRAGYRMFWPSCPWAFPDTLYWRKRITSGSSSHSIHSKRR